MIIITIITRPKVEKRNLVQITLPSLIANWVNFVLRFYSKVRDFSWCAGNEAIYFWSNLNFVVFKVDEPFLDYSEKCYSFSDPVLAKTLFNCGQWVTKLPFPHESLLINENNTKLSKNEKRTAKKGKASVIFENNSNLAGSIRPSNRIFSATFLYWTSAGKRSNILPKFVQLLGYNHRNTLTTS